MTTWNELTPDEQAYLTAIAEAKGEWVSVYKHKLPVGLNGHSLIDTKGFDVVTGTHEYARITAIGLLVWQQGQAPSEPDELTRLREQVAALTAERDALVQAAQAVIADCEAARVEPIHLQALRAAVYRVSNK